MKRYVVRLSAEERRGLEAIIHKGKSSAARLLKARILLKADVSEAGEGWSDSRIVEALETSVSMVYRVRRQLVEEGLEAVLSRKAPARPSVPRIFDGEKEARLIALACSQPPEGHARWSLRLLESKVVELGIVRAPPANLMIQRVLTENLTRSRTGTPPPQILGPSFRQVLSCGTELFSSRAQATARRRAGREVQAVPRSFIVAPHLRRCARPFGAAQIPTTDEAGVSGIGSFDPSTLLIAMAHDIVGAAGAFLAAVGVVPRLRFPIAQLLGVERGPGPSKLSP